ncbi:MAG: SulP family inorganic anion transporter [Pseudomonadota bacterium]
MKSYKQDFIAGVVVFLVAVPLCLGIALASGAPLYSGIISGIVGGILTGFISKSPVSVSGPAAGMVAVVLAAITQLGTFETFLLAVFIAGIIQIIIGLFKAGFLADFFPSNVINGLLAAIGILIIIKQLPLAFGYFVSNTEVMGTLKEAQTAFALQPLLHLLTHVNLGATIISLISLAILIFWDYFKHTFLRAIPAPVVVVLLGILINYLYQTFFPSLMLMDSHLVEVPVNQDLVGFFQQFQHPDWSAWANSQVYVYGFIIAVVASIESLLNLEASRKIDKKHRYASRNRELFAQGIGNTVCGLIGGIPVTSVIIRTTVNVQSGGSSKVSTIFHGFLLLLTVMLIPQWLNLIPLASLAAILIHTGYKLSKISLYRSMYKEGFAQFIPFIVTIVAIVSYNLLTGVLIGLAVSFFFILRYASLRRFDVINEKHTSGSILRLLLPQQVSFLSKAAFGSQLRSLPKNSNVVIDASNSDYIDKDIVELFQEFRDNQAPSKSIVLNMTGFKDKYRIHNQMNFINVTTHNVQLSLKPREILNILAEGNQRFLHNRVIHRNQQQEIHATSSSQHPIAVILSCIDSRVPVELIFDLGLGDVFTTRIAGNIISDDILASIEFACHVAGAKLILVLGHLGCGAIKAACVAQSADGYVDGLLAKVKPAIAVQNQLTPNAKADSKEFVTDVINLNVEHSMFQIYQKSEILRQLIDSKKINLAAGIYNIYDGTVQFTEEQFSKTTYENSKFQKS